MGIEYNSMKKYLIYLAPSIIFKVKANTIQSLCQFNYFTNYFENNYYLTLSPLSKRKIKKLVKDVTNSNIVPKGIFSINLFKFFFRETLNSLYQFLFCLIIFIKIKLENHENELYIYSRSILTSYLLSIFNIQHSFEFHNSEKNIFLSYIQEVIVKSYKVNKVFISKKLKNIIKSKYKKDQIYDFVIAPDSSLKFSQTDFKKVNLEDNLYKFLNKSNSIICVYAGSSGDGRGLEFIIQMASKLENIKFILIGEFDQINKINNFKNIFVVGKKSYLEANFIMSLADIGLMPYQRNLSMGRFKLNSIEWMSPLKMFDYMNNKLLILSSYHDVLEEVIKDNFSCIFIKNYDKVEDWINTIKNIDKYDIKRISNNAKKIFDKKYSYDERTKIILKNFKKV